MTKSKEDYRSLSGPQKAAALMLAVGRTHSSKLFERMDDEEIRELSLAMSTLGSLGAGIVERLFVEFADQLSTAGGLVGSYDSTERLLLETMPEDRVRQIMEELRGPRRSHHVGQARQRERSCSRELSEKRIPTDRCSRVV